MIRESCHLPLIAKKKQNSAFNAPRPVTADFHKTMAHQTELGLIFVRHILPTFSLDNVTVAVTIQYHPQRLLNPPPKLLRHSLGSRSGELHFALKLQLQHNTRQYHHHLLHNPQAYHHTKHRSVNS